MRKKPHETGREHGKEIGKHKPIGTALKRYGMGRDAEKSQNPRSRSLDKTGSLTVDFDIVFSQKRVFEKWEVMQKTQTLWAFLDMCLFEQKIVFGKMGAFLGKIFPFLGKSVLFLGGERYVSKELQRTLYKDENAQGRAL